MDKLKSFAHKHRISSSLNNLLGTDNQHQQYHYIADFDKVSEEECVMLDKKNNDIYKKNYDLYKHMIDKMKRQNALFKIENPPSPPEQPNNHSKLMTYTMRNVERNVRLQTFAVMHLLDIGCVVTYNKTSDSDENAFEPHEAIELCEKKFGENINNLFKKYQEHQTNMRKSKSINIPPIYDDTRAMPSAPPLYPMLHLQTQQLSSSAPPANRNQFNYYSNK